MLMMVVDALLGRVIAQAPTVLVVDDVQWADPATWDALSYLVAGFGHQRLALVTTHRDEAALNEHFQHWLGNLRRLPGTEELVLTRLDQEATEHQIAELLGRPPSPRLVEQVYERSRGNPYFSELLVRRGDLGSEELPDDLPDELSQALLDAWRGMSGPAREVARILAIAGRPTDLRTLAAIAAELGVSEAGSVREAVDAGVVVLGRDGAWFRHPLLAGVLAESYLPGEAAPVHAAWAAHLESVSAEGVDELRRLGDLALHRERAGHGSAAFAALLQGADLAEKLGAGREAADLLVRAVDLWEVAADATDTVGRARLLERAGLACFWVGRSRDGYALLRSARDLVSAERHPLWASRLAVRVARFEFSLDEALDYPLVEFERAVELSRVEPDSREHAEALAELAEQMFLVERQEEARRVVEDAVAAADRSRSAAAISSVHGSRAFVLVESDFRLADADAAVCWEQALASGDPWAIDWAHDVRRMIAYARGDVRRYHAHARDYYEWSVPQGDTVNPGVAPGRRLAGDGRPRGGPEHPARRAGRHRQPHRRGEDPAPRGRARGAAGRERHGERSPGPRPRDLALRGGSARGHGGIGHCRDAAGRSRPSSGVRARGARAALEHRGHARCSTS